MEKNKKIAILVAFIIIAIFIWMPRGGKKGRVSPPKQMPASTQEAAPRIKARRKQRSEFADWGRNPFVWLEKTGPLSGLSLSGIVWDEAAPYAIISGTVVRAGDEIAGKIVKGIEPNRVILTDGQNDYVLELK